MDYSKTHYYKFSNATPASRRKSTIPDFEQDTVPVSQENNTRANQQSSSRSSSDTPATPGFGPLGSVTPSLPSEEESATPSTPSEDQPATPGFGPLGSVTPSLPSESDSSSGSNSSSDSGSSSGSNAGGSNILWSWAFLSPIFSNIASVAQARFYNVAAIQEPLDIYINGQLLVSDLDYSEYTDFLYIIPGTYTLTVYRRTTPGVPIINSRVTFARNSACLVSILGDFNGFSLQFIC